MPFTKILKVRMCCCRSVSILLYFFLYVRVCSELLDLKICLLSRLHYTWRTALFNWAYLIRYPEPNICSSWVTNFMVILFENVKKICGCSWSYLPFYLWGWQVDALLMRYTKQEQVAQKMLCPEQNQRRDNSNREMKE